MPSSKRQGLSMVVDAVGAMSKGWKRPDPDDGGRVSGVGRRRAAGGASDGGDAQKMREILLIILCLFSVYR